MLRFLLSVIALSVIIVFALSYVNSRISVKPENSVSVIESGKIIRDIRKMNEEHKVKIKENEKLVEDIDEKN